MFTAKKTFLSIAIIAMVAALSSGANAQTRPGPNDKVPKITTQQTGSEFKKPDCPVTYVDSRCLPRRPLPKVASKQDCECEVVKVNSGGRTLWVRNCYLQLPDNTVFYCKPTPHLKPAG